MSNAQNLANEINIRSKDPNILHVVKSLEDSKGFKFTILRENIGFPDLKKAKENLIKFFRDNQQFLFALENHLDGAEGALIDEVIKHFYNNFGPYGDNLMGIENLFENIPIFSCGRYLTGSSAEGGRAIIVGAGPSLDVLMPKLKRVYEEKHGFIIAVDAVLKRLLAEGIRPDLVVSSERVDECVSFFDGISYSTMHDIPVLFNGISHPKTLAACKASEKYFYLRKINEYAWLGAKEMEVDTTPYVTQTAATMALKLGFNQIILVGQDFAYGQKGESHAAILNEHAAFNEKAPSNPMMVKSVVKGVEVATNRLLSQFALDLEFLIEMNPRISFINCSPFGRKIKGARSLNLDGIAFKAQKKVKLESSPFPVPFSHLVKKSKMAYEEFEKNPLLNPRQLATELNIADLGYHFLIQSFVVWQSGTWSEPWKEDQFLETFQKTYGKVREDLMKILNHFLEGAENGYQN